MTAEELPTPDEILATHEEIEDAYGLKHRGVRVAGPRIDLREIIDAASEYDDVYHSASFLLRKLITTHLFEDGNKRTAWLTALEYLARHNIEPTVEKERVPKVLKKIRRYRVPELAEWLETGEIDESRLYP